MTPFVTQYTYDAGDRLDGMTLPSGRVVTHTRDTLRRLEQITTTVGGSTINVIDALKYQADGALTEQTFGNGLGLVRDYDQQGRLTHETLTASVLVASEDFEYDHNSNLKQRITPTATYDYDYDALDRLTNQTGSGDQLDYQYDANGNRTSRDVNGQVTTLTTLTESNRLDTINSVSVGLNPAGALDSFEQRTFEYSAAGRLSKVRENGQLVATYRYNQAGLRTHKTVGSVTTLYHYDLAGRLISETEPDGTVIREYIYALGVPVAQIDGGTPERIRYVHTDHLGSPWLATDDQAGIIWRWQGRAFGDHVPDVYPDGDGSLTEINLRFPGQYADAETGFYYNWNRYYDPATGRYLSSDPIGLAGGLNTYGYAAQNPITFTDPTGEAIPFIPILIKLGVGFAEGFAIDVAAQLLNNGLDFSCVDFGRAASVAAVDTLLGFGILKTVDRVRDAARFSKKVNLGSGDNPMADAVNVDLRNISGVNVVANANKLPFANRSFTEAHAINPFGFNPVSAETARILQPGSILKVSGNVNNKFAQQELDTHKKMDKKRTVHSFIEKTVGVRRHRASPKKGHP